MINVQLAHEKSHFEHRCGNNSNLGDTVAHAQPSVTHQDEEIQIQILNLSQVNFQVKILKRMIENQQQNKFKSSQKMRLRVGLRKS